MNPNKILKFAFMSVIGVYVLVAWIVSQQPIPEGQEPQNVDLFFKVLAGLFFMQIVTEPIISNALQKAKGAYTKDVMIIKLALYESGAIFGLVLSFISRDVNYVAGFGIIAFLLMMIRVPIPEE